MNKPRWKRPANWAELDALLRRLGFQIHSRAEGREPVWRDKDRKCYPQTTALWIGVKQPPDQASP
jgi:hypothetical protein